MNKIVFLLMLLVTSAGAAQDVEISSEEIEINEYIKGSLIKPASEEKASLVLLLAGSGPSDRDGNQPFMKNDALKKVAIELEKAGIASFRYDKRVLQAQKLNIQEKDMRFDDFVTDAETAIAFFKDKKTFSKIIVLGHSQGSLVGMLAAKDHADGFISLAGLARPIDSLLLEQITNQMPTLKESTQKALSEMRANGSTTNYNPLLESVFRPSVQPFMVSWMQHNPTEVLAGLKIPVLLINGTNDLQVQPREAELLKEANPAAEVVILENMNHVLRKVEGDPSENMKAYNAPELPLHPELMPAIIAFIRSI